jgi:predicted dehydrogenase
MKQAVQDLRGGGTRIVDVPIPSAGRGQVVVRTAFSLLSSGTERMAADFAGKSLAGKARARPDLVRQTLEKARREGVLAAVDAVRSRLAEPMALGYSSSGTVVEVGDGIDDLRPGDRVACAGGGYAVHGQYAAVPRLLVARLPDNVSLDSGAFATLGAIALHGLRLADVQVGERVAVIGLGLIGQLAVAVASAAGVEAFGIDLRDDRVRLAERRGARGFRRDGAEAAVLAASGGTGVDAVLICADTTSNDPAELAAELARDRGRVIAIGAVGMELPRRTYYGKELTFIVSRSYGPGRYDAAYEEGGLDYPVSYVRWTEGRNLQSVVDLMGQGRLEVESLITHRLPLDQAAKAYDLIAHDANALGVLLDHGVDELAPIGQGRTVQLSSRAPAAAPVGIGVLGAGRFAQGVVLPLLKARRGVALLGIASARGLSAAEAGKRFGFAYATSEPERVLHDPEVNTIAVLTRHHLHASQTAAALRAGKNVWCEKPLALRRDELTDIADALVSSSGILAVGFNRRFAPLAQRLRRFLGEMPGPVTMAYRVNAGPLPPNHWVLDLEQGGGRILAEVCHFIDFLTFVAGALPRRLEARGSGGEDVVVTVEFAGGSLGTILYAAHGSRAFGKERFEVFGGGKTAVLDDFRRLELVSEGTRQTAHQRWRADKGHAGLWEVFLRAVETGGEPPVRYAELFAVSEATLAAAESVRSGAAIELGPPAYDWGHEGGRGVERPPFGE